MATSSPQLHSRRSILVVTVKWILIAVQAAIGCVLLAVGLLPSPCPQQVGGAVALGAVLLGFVVLEAGLPSTLLRMTPWFRNRAPAPKRHGAAAAAAGVLSILAVLLIPDVIPARVSCNESAAVGRLRVFVSAQRAYSELNGGYFEAQSECLRVPAQCLPGVALDHPGFAAADHSSIRDGYRWEVTVGSRPTAASGAHSRTSVTAFAYTAAPVEPMKTGVRAFCADSAGTLCARVGEAPRVTRDATCDLSTCTSLK